MRIRNISLISLLLLLAISTADADRRRMMLKLRPAGGASSTLNTGLTAYWKLDEASGTRVDSGGNGQDLTDNNTVTSGTGKINNAADFEDTNTEYLSRADSATMSLGADTDFSLFLWYNAETISIFDQILLSKSDTFVYDAVTVEYMVEINNAAFGRLSFSVANGSASGSVQANTFGAPGAGTWHSIAVWHDSGANTLNIQVDNGTVDSASWSGGTQDGAADFNIGAASGSRVYDGLIDEVGFWKRVLTSDERTELYNSGNAKTCCPF